MRHVVHCRVYIPVENQPWSIAGVEQPPHKCLGQDSVRGEGQGEVGRGGGVCREGGDREHGTRARAPQLLVFRFSVVQASFRGIEHLLWAIRSSVLDVGLIGGMAGLFGGMAGLFGGMAGLGWRTASSPPLSTYCLAKCAPGSMMRRESSTMARSSAVMLRARESERYCKMEERDRGRGWGLGGSKEGALKQQGVRCNREEGGYDGALERYALHFVQHTHTHGIEREGGRERKPEAWSK